MGWRVGKSERRESLQHRTWMIIRVWSEIKAGTFPARRCGWRAEMELLKILKPCGSMAFVGFVKTRNLLLTRGARGK